ncbi:hypothetical protein IDH19_02030 [Pelagibacterales bacterium SAG-MED48]|nr:hypothetical protein [Pelagibacterales bacterium SAG-MED48]|tara:strand:+ start:67 stop:489 length:423 start_codon:yes stop_codon:yes gene_type:complete
MKKTLITFIFILSTISLTQADNHVKITEQQAGSSYSENTEETFKNEIGNCEDSGVLMLRATVKNDISRSSPENASEAETLMKEGMKLCNENRVFEAKLKLEDAKIAARAGLIDGEDPSITKVVAENNETSKEEKPWWKFW